MIYHNESEFEGYLRALIKEHITKAAPSIYALKNKKAVDILICKDAPVPELFFLEVKYHQTKHGRLGFGSGKGGGFQPEIVSTKPAYFESNLRWVLASEEHNPGKVLFLTSAVVRKYLAGGQVAEKFNNFQKRIFREERWLDEREFVAQLDQWLGAKATHPIIPPDLASGEAPVHTGQCSTVIGNLFDPEPESWGLRGDPFLWRQMKGDLLTTPLPETEAEFDSLISNTFRLRSGKPIATPDDFHVEAFSHGGMSSGVICPAFWREQALPLLKDRFIAAQPGSQPDAAR